MPTLIFGVSIAYLTLYLHIAIHYNAIYLCDMLLLMIVGVSIVYGRYTATNMVDNSNANQNDKTNDDEYDADDVEGVEDTDSQDVEDEDDDEDVDDADTEVENDIVETSLNDKIHPELERARLIVEDWMKKQLEKDEYMRKRSEHLLGSLNSEPVAVPPKPLTPKPSGSDSETDAIVKDTLNTMIDELP